MLPAPSIDDLADRIRRRTSEGSPDRWQGPYILFIGEALARAAGAPTREEIAREALRTFDFEPESVAKASAEEVLAKFAAHTDSLSRPQFVRMLRSLYARVPVPTFYQDLAPLVREGYFPLIITTNFDTLLEQALAHVGLRSSEYRVTTFGTRRMSSGAGVSSRTPMPGGPITHLVKLHGDLAQDTAHVTPDEIEQALGSSRQWIKADLRGDMIMVGHVLSEDPIDRWLGHTPDRELWWVNTDEPGDTDRSRIESWARELYWITGELGRPAVFLTQLALRLRAPDVGAVAQQPRAMNAPEPAPVAAEPADSIAETLNREILRSQSVLYNLNQERTAGERPPQVEAQIRYQKRQIVRLEDRVRSLPEVKRQTLATVGQIVESVRQARGAADAARLDPLASYLEGQLQALTSELGKEAPNQILVSATLCSTLAAADRLLTEFGSEVVRPDDVKRLAALVPAAAGKVVL